MAKPGTGRKRSKDQASAAAQAHIAAHIAAYKEHLGPKVPLSETLTCTVPALPDKVLESLTKDGLISLLRGMAAAAPDKVITRNYFRVHSGIRESFWRAHFGSFREYKSASGVTPSRSEERLAQNLAKHAAADHYRTLSNERAAWGDRFPRKCPHKEQRFAIASDFHDREVDEFALSVWLDTLRRYQPDVVVLNGDVFDLPEFGKYDVDPRVWDVTGRIKFAHERILGPTRDAAPNARIDFIEANHEARLLKHLADASPSMRAVLADLHGFTFASLLGLDKYEINYVGRADLAAWNTGDFRREVTRRNYKVYHDFLIVHHEPEGRKYNLPGVCGHHHKHEMWTGYSPRLGHYEFHQLGAMCRRIAHYTDAEKWSNGFMLADVLPSRLLVNFSYVPITDIAATGGKIYRR